MAKSLEICLAVVCVLLVDCQYTTDRSGPEMCENQWHRTNVEDLVSIAATNVKNILREIPFNSDDQKELKLLTKELKMSQCPEKLQNQSRQINVLLEQNEKLQEEQQNQSRLIEVLIEQNLKQHEQQLQDLFRHHQQTEQYINQSLQLLLQHIQVQHSKQLENHNNPERDVNNGYKNMTLVLNTILQHQKGANVECDVKLNARQFLNSTRVLGVISMDSNRAYGLTVLNNELFVVRASSQVHVYNVNNYTLTRTITIPGSPDLRAIVASPQHNCLFLNYNSRKIVYRYNLSDNVTTQWSIGGPCESLSLTSTYNVLVTLSYARQINEYTPDGRLVIEISLDSSIDNPKHCIQLSSDRLVVSHEGESLHRVCLIRMSGSLIKCYGASSGSDVGSLSYPHDLAGDTYGNVLVADSNNDRIVLLSPSLTFLGYITVPGYTRTYPRTLHFDEIDHRLYIGRHRVIGLTV